MVPVLTLTKGTGLYLPIFKKYFYWSETEKAKEESLEAY